MSYGPVVMKILILFLFSSVFLGTDADVYYVPKITDSVLSCDNFNNDFMNCDELELGSLRGEEGDDAAKLNGKLKTLQDILPDYDIEIDIYRCLDLGEEFLFNSRSNFCSSLDNTDAPWWPIIDKLNISGCPIPVNIFEVQGMTVSLDAFRDFMSHDFCGEYRIQISFMDVTEKLSCHILQLCIVEVSDEDV